VFFMVLDLRLMKIGSLGRFPLFLPVREGEISSRPMELNRTVDGVIFCGRFARIVYTLRSDRAVKFSDHVICF
jgi:hypothetical protein